MNPKIVRSVVWGAVAVAVVVALYLRFATNFRLQLGTNSRVNRLIEEADARVAEADAKEKTLGLEADLLYTGLVPNELAADQAKLEEAVAKTNDILVKIVEDYRAAAAKYEEAKKAGSGVVSQYLDLESQVYQCRADAQETRRKTIALMVDTSYQSKGERAKKHGELVDEKSTLEQKFDTLVEAAAKIRENNKDKFN
jgi:hypothetical protein